MTNTEFTPPPHERYVRDQVTRYAANDDSTHVMVPLGVLRALLSDIEQMRAATQERDPG